MNGMVPVFNQDGKIVTHVKPSVPGFQVGQFVVFIGSCPGRWYKNGNVKAIYEIVARSPHPIRPDWPWRYKLDNVDYPGKFRNSIEEIRLEEVK